MVWHKRMNVKGCFSVTNYIGNGQVDFRLFLNKLVDNGIACDFHVHGSPVGGFLIGIGAPEHS